MMASYRVVRTDKESASAGGYHRHIAALCLEGGRSVPKLQAIRNIRSATENYYTLADGQRAEVEVANRCALCYSEYLRTNKDTTIKNNLLSLPDC
jgi:predicted adenine nucleotide alpha hydrolase (AANH) superfamily ATPase